MKQAITNVPPCADETGAQIRRRREAANAPELHRLACGRYDPLDPLPRPVEPSSYGMTPDQLRAYGRYLRSQGWADWEIAARLVDPRELQRQLDDAEESDRIVNPWRHAAYV
ncbi:MAG TPA: hypothetical protein VL551_28210 [Actinospica sp.]|nr:hypothetical protein [Actinospica sp.]